MRVIIAGGRDFQDYKYLASTMDAIYKRQIAGRGAKTCEVIVGRARGADTLGEQWATEKGHTVTAFPANWDLFGNRAGMLRNTEMAKYAAESPDKLKLLVAFWDGNSRGTQNMIATATKLKIPTMIVPY